MDYDYTVARITKTKATIELYEDAIDALTTTPIESYSLDTGQSQQKVTRANLAELQKQLDALYNRLCVLEARAYGGGTNVRPYW